MNRDHINPLSSPTAAKCREKSAELRRDIDAFLNSGGQITHLKSFLTSTEPDTRTQNARQRGMKKFNGGMAK